MIEIEKQIADLLDYHGVRDYIFIVGDPDSHDIKFRKQCDDLWMHGAGAMLLNLSERNMMRDMEYEE